MESEFIPTVRFDPHSAPPFSFTGYEKTILVTEPEKVLSGLREVEEALENGFYAAGFVSYEAANAINSELPAGKPGDFPLLWFGIFRNKVQEERIHPNCLTVKTDTTSFNKNSYFNAIKVIKKAIASGETYQVNYTFRQKFSYSGNPLDLYAQLCCNQKAEYSAYINSGKHQIISASPELFFHLKERKIVMQPMKGTAPRHPIFEKDQKSIDMLKSSEKERAENLMIVDMIRNDLSKIAEPGSVKVPNLFDVTSYPTLHQMTSRVTAQVKDGIKISDIFKALFPCGSVTGAPKRRTMEIINGLEGTPRGVYCGAIGYMSPNGEANFSVAIRTAVIDMGKNVGELGLGSGITWDSDPDVEYAECLTKGEFLNKKTVEFSIIETLRHDKNGYLLLEKHLKRLSKSASYFGFNCDLSRIKAELERLSSTLYDVNKVRLVLAEDGSFNVTSDELVESTEQTVKNIAISEVRNDPDDTFLYHKTTDRKCYEEERRKAPHCYDVLFTNKLGEVSEGSFNNIVISLGGKLLTPPIESGLLPGVLREELLEVGAVEEKILTLQDIQHAEKIWLVNSVRGWVECRLTDSMRF